MTFIELCIIGKAEPDEINDFIDRWHQDPVAISLWAYLGMSSEEYASWVQNPESLSYIIDKHRS